MKPLESNWQAYYDSFRSYAHQLLDWGYKDSRSKISSSHQEEEITGFIADAIEKRLDSIDAPDWLDHFCIKEEKPVHAAGRTGKRRKKIDILIECSSYRPRLKYTFEAKRLRETSHPITNYVGEEGIQRFLRGSYASSDPEAAMIGYVQNNSAGYWADRLQDEFDKDLIDELRIRKGLVHNQIIPSLPEEWLSSHERDNGMMIDIYHIFIDCS